MTDSAQQQLAGHIDTVESAYEFMLAYAAQGYEADQSNNPGNEIRVHLTALDEALAQIGDLVAQVAASVDGDDARSYEAFIAAAVADAAKAQGAVRLVLARPGISSQLIDNLNASTHLRALLTDLFLLDEAYKKGA